jgi:hypothetical protein
MHKNATKCNETLSKWSENKHGASKIIDTFETYHLPTLIQCMSHTPSGMWVLGFLLWCNRFRLPCRSGGFEGFSDVHRHMQCRSIVWILNFCSDFKFVWILNFCLDLDKKIVMDFHILFIFQICLYFEILFSFWISVWILNLFNFEIIQISNLLDFAFVRIWICLHFEFLF